MQWDVISLLNKMSKWQNSIQEEENLMNAFKITSALPANLAWMIYITGSSFAVQCIRPLCCGVKSRKKKLQHELQLGLAWDSQLIKVLETAGWGCLRGEKCWLKLELLAKVADSEAGRKTTLQCGQNERSESRVRQSSWADNNLYEKKQSATVWIHVVTIYLAWVWDSME